MNSGGKLSRAGVSERNAGGIYSLIPLSGDSIVQGISRIGIKADRENPGGVAGEIERTKGRGGGIYRSD